MTSYEIEAVTLPEQPTAVAAATLTVPEIGGWLGRTFSAVAELVAAQGVEFAGMPFARFHRHGGDRFTVEAGFPVVTPVTGSDGVRAATLPGGPAAVTAYLGPYDGIEPAYTALTTWIRAQGGEPVGDAWEIYHSDPVTQPDPATWRTDVVQPYRL